MDKYIIHLKQALVELLKLPFLLIGMIIRTAFANIWARKTGVIAIGSYLIMAAFAAGFFYLWAQLTITPAVLVYCMLSWLIWDFQGASASLAQS